MSEHTTELYFECHITVEPVFGERLERLQTIAGAYKFTVADLLMHKRLEDTPERSRLDTFMTGRSKDYADLENRMELLIVACRYWQFPVWRYKIENTLRDVRVTR